MYRPSIPQRLSRASCVTQYSTGCALREAAVRLQRVPSNLPRVVALVPSNLPRTAVYRNQCRRRDVTTTKAVSVHRALISSLQRCTNMVYA